MPVRSLTSSVFKWPDINQIQQAVHIWAEEVGKQRGDVRRIGYFGSYARGDWGVGSDLDLLIIIDQSEVPFEKRFLAWDTLILPVPNDLLVYMQDEWESLSISDSHFHRILNNETIWVFKR